jgi:hypothetical protein
MKWFLVEQFEGFIGHHLHQTRDSILIGSIAVLNLGFVCFGFLKHCAFG